MWGHHGLEARLIPPWRFGVYREDIEDIELQEALNETGLMTMEEVWRRISHLPDAEKLYVRIREHASPDTQGVDLANNFFHNVLSTSVLNTDLDSARQQPGGVVQVTGASPSSMVPPVLKTLLAPYHELWVVDDDMQDWTTVLLIEPDVIVSPYFKRANQFVKRKQPFSLIRPNMTPGYFWGRPEILDLMDGQGLLSQWLVQLRRLTDMQIDKLLAFSGENITDEQYQEFRNGGYINLGQGGSVNDLTPQIPEALFRSIEFVKRSMDEISGFANILSGQGEAGVRAGNHAETLVRTASPPLRDRALLVERQCAVAADKSLDLLAEKEGDAYVTVDGGSFLLYDLPDDHRVVVDSHSSAPIFADNHESLVAFGVKSQFIDGASAIELLPYPKKKLLLARYREAQAKKAEFVREHPEVLTGGKKKAKAAAASAAGG